MIDSRFILLEGMPSTGKTTMARFLRTQMERNRIDATWIHEIAQPHPLLFFDEASLTLDEFRRLITAYPQAAEILSRIATVRRSAVGICLTEVEWNYRDAIGEDAYQALLGHDSLYLPLDRYTAVALEKWECFVSEALQKRDEVFVVDSAIFQFQIFTFLLKRGAYEELQHFIDQLAEIIKPLDPCLVFLHREDAEASIAYLENDRGTEYLEYIWTRDKDYPYYADLPPGAESFKRFLREYGCFVDRLYQRFTAQKLSLNVSDGQWIRHEDEMLAFLELERIPDPEASPRDGMYINEEHGFVIEVNGISIVDPNGNTRPLHLKSENEFYVDWIPTILRFEENKIIIAGSQTGSRWTTTGLVFRRINPRGGCI